MSTKHKTDVVLGDKYRDTVTGLEGKATAVTAPNRVAEVRA